jgi:hypothetical protein
MLLEGDGSDASALSKTRELHWLRQQAYTRMIEAYEELRDGVWTVRRRHGDGPRHAPTLTRRRSRNKKSQVRGHQPH